MTAETEVQRVVREALDRFGRIDVWVNNVGQGITRSPSQLTDEDIDEVMQVNVKSALYGMQEVLPHFKERGTGHIINVSSMLGRIPFAMVRSAYCGAKHFLNALTATFARRGAADASRYSVFAGVSGRRENRIWIECPARRARFTPAAGFAER